MDRPVSHPPGCLQCCRRATGDLAVPAAWVVVGTSAGFVPGSKTSKTKFDYLPYTSSIG